MAPTIRRRARHAFVAAAHAGDVRPRRFGRGITTVVCGPSEDNPHGTPIGNFGMTTRGPIVWQDYGQAEAGIISMLTPDDMLAVSGIYGFIVGLVGTQMPQFSSAPSGEGLSSRNIQSMVAFGLIGLAFVYLGLAAPGLVPDPLARIALRFPGIRMLVMGALIGGFLGGRPFGLFRQLFRDLAESHNPIYATAAFMLQSTGKSSSWRCFSS